MRPRAVQRRDSLRCCETVLLQALPAFIAQAVLDGVAILDQLVDAGFVVGASLVASWLLRHRSAFSRAMLSLTMPGATHTGMTMHRSRPIACDDMLDPIPVGEAPWGVVIR